MADYEIGQQAPTATHGPSMHDLVMADLDRRKAFGLLKYGTLLQAGNGRDALKDAYEEVLDLAVYLRQAIEERDTGRDAARRSRYDDVREHLRTYHRFGQVSLSVWRDTDLVQAHLTEHRGWCDHEYQAWGDE